MRYLAKDFIRTDPDYFDNPLKSERKSPNFFS